MDSSEINKSKDGWRQFLVNMQNQYQRDIESALALKLATRDFHFPMADEIIDRSQKAIESIQKGIDLIDGIGG